MENGTTIVKNLNTYSLGITTMESLDYSTFSSENGGFFMQTPKEIKETMMINPIYSPIISAILAVDNEKQVINITFPQEEEVGKDHTKLAYELIDKINAVVNASYKEYLDMSEIDREKNTEALSFIFAKKYFFSDNRLFAYQKDNFAKIRFLYPDEFRKKFIPITVENALSISSIKQGIIFSVNDSVYASSRHFLTDFFFLLTLSAIEDIIIDYESKLGYSSAPEYDELSYQMSTYDGFYFLSQYLLSLFTPRFPELVNSVSEHSMRDRIIKFQNIIPLVPSVMFTSFPYIQDMYRYDSLLKVLSKDIEVEKNKLPPISLLLTDKEYLKNILLNKDITDGYPAKLAYSVDETVYSYSQKILLSPETVESCSAAIYKNHITFIIRLKIKLLDRQENEKLLEIEFKKLLKDTDIRSVTVFLNPVDLGY